MITNPSQNSFGSQKKWVGGDYNESPLFRGDKEDKNQDLQLISKKSSINMIKSKSPLKKNKQLLNQNEDLKMYFESQTPGKKISYN